MAIAMQSAADINQMNINNPQKSIVSMITIRKYEEMNRLEKTLKLDKSFN